MAAVFFLVCFFASVVGAICGMGGGVIIKPVLDFFRLGEVATINFLSACTVFSMSLYSVCHNVLSGRDGIDARTGTPLALGAIVGGMCGGGLFAWVVRLMGGQDRAGAVQAGCLFLLTLFTFLYTIWKDKIHTHKVTALPAVLAIGLGLGLSSSFLGIGGGPINLVVLFYFFSMDIKTAATNSLYVILLSQFANLAGTFATGAAPPFRTEALVSAVVGGVCGGIVGRGLHRHIDQRATQRLFLCAMALIMGICVYNVFNLAFA